MELPLLWPVPRSIRLGDQDLLFPPRLAWNAPGELAGVIDLARTRLGPRGIESGGRGGVVVDVRVERTLATPQETYAIELDPRGIRVRLASPRAAHAACATLVQLLCGFERTSSGLRARALVVADTPDFAARGALLDVSRTRVPRMETLFALVERLATFKTNQLQLYTEHTFAYAGHEEVWRDASPFTPEEIRALDRFCLARGVELVPNQQSFGHMHRWLKHPRYRDLAEVPEGVEHAFSLEREPYSLDLADPRALALLDDLFDQLLPCFSSRQVNVGCDETFDLGLGRSRERCVAQGVERVYVERLAAVHEKLAARGRRMQFWGDIIVKRPDLVPCLPRDAIALEWGYEAGHPFDLHAGVFAASGLSYYVCPGTSSWQSIGGRSANLLANLSEAARSGRAHQAGGYLVTDWGDRGHLQPRIVSEAGLALSAGCAWNAGTDLADRERVAEVLDRCVYEDDARAIAGIVLDLGTAGLQTGATSTNGTPLFFLLAFAREPLPHPRIEGLTDAGLVRARAALESLMPRIAAVRSRRPDAELLRDELAFAQQLLVFACDFGRARLQAPASSPVSSIEPRVRAALANRLAPLVTEHRRLWLERDRPGGLAESAAWLERVLALLAA